MWQFENVPFLLAHPVQTNRNPKPPKISRALRWTALSQNFTTVQQQQQQQRPFNGL